MFSSWQRRREDAGYSNPERHDTVGRALPAACVVSKGEHTKGWRAVPALRSLGPAWRCCMAGSRRCRGAGTARRLLLAGTVARTMFSSWQRRREDAGYSNPERHDTVGRALPAACVVSKGEHTKGWRAVPALRSLGPAWRCCMAGSRRCRGAGTARRLLLAGTVARTMFSSWQRRREDAGYSNPERHDTVGRALPAACVVSKGEHTKGWRAVPALRSLGPAWRCCMAGSRRCRGAGTARRLLLAGTVARTMFSGWQSTQRRQGCPLSAKCGVQRRQCNLTAQRQHGVASARAPPGTGCLHSIAATRCCRSAADRVHTRPACLPGCRTGPTPD